MPFSPPPLYKAAIFHNIRLTRIAPSMAFADRGALRGFLIWVPRYSTSSRVRARNAWGHIGPMNELQRVFLWYFLAKKTRQGHARGLQHLRAVLMQLQMSTCAKSNYETRFTAPKRSLGRGLIKSSPFGGPFLATLADSINSWEREKELVTGKMQRIEVKKYLTCLNIIFVLHFTECVIDAMAHSPKWPTNTAIWKNPQLLPLTFIGSRSRIWTRGLLHLLYFYILCHNLFFFLSWIYLVLMCGKMKKFIRIMQTTR